MNEITDVRVAAVTALNLDITVPYQWCIPVGVVVILLALLLLLVMSVTTLDPRP